MAILADQIFMEIPARRVQRTFLCCPSVEWMGVLAIDRELFREAEGDVVFAMRRGIDFLGRARLLAAEIIRRQPSVAVARPPRLQPGILRCIAGVDD